MTGLEIEKKLFDLFGFDDFVFHRIDSNRGELRLQRGKSTLAGFIVANYGAEHRFYSWENHTGWIIDGTLNTAPYCWEHVMSINGF